MLGARSRAFGAHSVSESSCCVALGSLKNFFSSSTAHLKGAEDTKNGAFSSPSFAPVSVAQQVPKAGPEQDEIQGGLAIKGGLTTRN
mmetsp:Transcript_991/g.2378  ORF Transcript_991/g.2378 Transcript_991/m.2378 type:complete len:87 (-) Transcript_991:283-543(-)